MKIPYRPEIDGLRGIAVLAVVFYHAKDGLGHILPVPGGYVGVDIFFVISGYLITGIVLNGIIDGTFSFRGFYERRIRRILPALLVVVLATLPFAWGYMLPETLLAYAFSGLSALFSVSNFWFLSEDSYTAAASELKPLLHTWSLSLEEQFYLVFPVLLLVIWRRFSRRTGVLISILALISLVAAQIITADNRDVSFFMLPTRMWELLAGGFLAYRELISGRAATSRGSEYLPFLGVVVILGSVFLFHDGTPHPSIVTVLPVAGAALLIWYCRPRTLATVLLSAWPLRSLGLVSYSFYLWHYPVLAFARIRFGDISALDVLGLILLSLGLAIVTYWTVEKPFRNRSQINMRRLAICVGGAASLVLAANMYLLASDGRAGHLGPVADIFTDAQRIEVLQGGRNCHSRSTDDLCRFDFGEGDRAVIAVGDSHAAALANNLLIMSREHGIDYVQLTQAGCPYAPGLYRFDGADRRLRSECTAYSEAAREFLLAAVPSIIVISARFPLYLLGERFNNKRGGKERGGPSILAPEQNGQPDPAVVIERIQAAITELLALGHTVVLIYPVPEAGWDVPHEVYTNSGMLQANDMPNVLANFELWNDLSQFKIRAESTYSMLDEIGDLPNLIRIYPEGIFCNSARGVCLTHSSAAFFYADDDHLSPLGAQMVFSSVEEKLFAGVK